MMTAAPTVGTDHRPLVGLGSRSSVTRVSSNGFVYRHMIGAMTTAKMATLRSERKAPTVTPTRMIQSVASAVTGDMIMLTRVTATKAMTNQKANWSGCGGNHSAMYCRCAGEVRVSNG